MGLIRLSLITSMLFLATAALAGSPSPNPGLSRQDHLLGTKSQKPQFAYVSGDHSISVYRIDAATGSLTPVPGSPFTIIDDNDTTSKVMALEFSTNAAGTFAYVMEEDTATRFTFGGFSVYRINATTGALTSVPVSYIEDDDGLDPSSLNINPAGTFAYVVNQGIHSENGSISAYRIDAATGSLTPVPGSPFTARESPVSLTFNPAGTFVYVATLGHPGRHNGGIAAYRINAATGALALVPGGSLATGVDSEFLGVTFNSAGTFAYVVTPGEGRHHGSVSAYRINAATGALKPVPSSTLGTEIVSNFPDLTITPSGTFAYVMNQYSDSGQTGSVSAYLIDAATGGLTPVPGSPFTAGYGPISITLNPAGTFAYVANSSNGGSIVGNISAYSINATTGALIPVPGSPFAAGDVRFGSVTINPSGAFAYVGDGDGGVIWGYRINAVTGALTPVAGSPFAAGTNPGSVMIVQP